MTAKLHDVARLAGVSTSTVSRAIHEPQMVNEETRKRVQEAVKQLGYHPSRVARRLRVERGRAHLIGLVLPDIQNPFFADLARGVQDLARSHGYTVFVGNSDESEEQQRQYIDVMRAESVDGLILPPVSETDRAAVELAKSGIPVVCVDRRLSRVAVDTVVADNVRGAHEATEHLLSLGHRRIGFLEGLPHLSTSRERLQGYRQALEDHGLELDPALVRQGDSRQAGGREMAEQLLGMDSPPTALFVGNNLMTLGALETIYARGLRIPDDLALVSYDDMPWAMAFNPPLTAVRQPGYEMGRQAMELLLRRIQDPQRSAVLLMLQPELVVRKSSGGALPARRSTRRTG
jgi:LacI family transcriptional regulator/LacI family repressor for deo operon, udp, cdd, tsx, nupC, and nupG